MIALRGFAPRGAGGPYEITLAAGEVLGLMAAGGEEGRLFLEAAAAARAGRVAIDGRPRTARNVAYAPDEPEQILFGRTGRDALRGPGAARALADLGGEHLLARDFLTLSSGERRRLALAAVLGSGRPLLLFDRPTAGLDPDGQERFWQALRASGAAAVVAVLDEAEALRCDLLLPLPSSGAPERAAEILPMSLARRAHWPPSPTAQLAWALFGERTPSLENLRLEVEARCAARHRQ